MPLALNTRLYYAQVTTRHGLPPTAAIREGLYYGASPHPGKIKIKCAHARYPMHVESIWCTADIPRANELLATRISTRVAEHEYQISLLRHALTQFQSTITITWPEPAITIASKPLPRGFRRIRIR